MQDKYATLAPALDSPANEGFAITPSDSSDLQQVTRALYVGEGGDLAVEMRDGASLTFKDVPQGSILPLRVRKVLQQTTAAYLVGLC
ncbi:spike base protein, RCAP_Rcc01079 family [Aquamicrobium zhengzhouense]|uniref:Uncharacterized protein n=1 Tax=Aquamicrobium zhengzhouense TaxID=2781738 RepID=A0ABS0S7F6_9HYPH|nr:hypothetical protein [Aquamicrobium zhengzhouense]MBI1619221.1 hypothetical protein [Aquamicrobium zhengzhouense]